MVKIRSNSGIDRVYIRIKLIEYSNQEKDKEYWCWVVPDNEGAKWIVQIAFTAKINDMEVYMHGQETDESETRYKILEFGI